VGTLTIPAAGSIYTDTQTLIYTVQRHPIYAPLCRPIWQAATVGQNRILSSDLALMETLVMPLRNIDTILEAQFERFLLHSDVTLLPITQKILREAARLRAAIPALKTPDALHAATSLIAGCALFVTNDSDFRRVPGLPIAILDDVLAAP
jgi:predicted nucleic acid-binding protein